MTDQQFSKITLLLLITLAFPLSCSPQSPSSGQSTLSRIKQDGVLRVGYIVFPPTVTKDLSTGELGGHHVATVREIARLASWELQFIETDWVTFAAGLDSGRFDVSIAPTFVTVPRAVSVAFTRPLFFAGNSAIVRRTDDRFSTIESLGRSDITIAVTQGEAGYEYAKANLPDAKLIEYSGSDQSLAFQAVISGRADVALGDAYVTAQFAKEHPEVKDLFADYPYNLTPVSWAVRQRDVDLLTFLDNCIESLDFQGKLREFEREAGAHWLHVKKTWER